MIFVRILFETFYGYTCATQALSAAEINKVTLFGYSLSWSALCFIPLRKLCHSLGHQQEKGRKICPVTVGGIFTSTNLRYCEYKKNVEMDFLGAGPTDRG